MWQIISETKVDVTICLNEKIVKEKSDEGTEQQFYEYDFNQFRELQDNLNREDVEKNAEKYIDYVPKKAKTTDEIIAEQNKKIDALIEVIMKQQ